MKGRREEEGNKERKGKEVRRREEGGEERKKEGNIVLS